MKAGPGFFPLQCDRCGRELINMRCRKCFSLERFFLPHSTRPAVNSPKNRGGFPKYSQLSPTVTSPTSVPRSPRKRPSSFEPFQFKGEGGRLLKLADGMNVDIDPSVVNGHRRPFMSYVKKFEDFTVLTKLKFEWALHKWETSEIPYERDMTTTAIFRCLCIHFSQFLNAIQKCNSPEGCLCGAARHEVNILGYELFDVKGSFIIKVVIGIDEDRQNID